MEIEEKEEKEKGTVEYSSIIEISYYWPPFDMDQNSSDPFASENTGTARFIGGGMGSGGTDHCMDSNLLAGTMNTGNGSGIGGGVGGVGGIDGDDGGGGGGVGIANEFQTMKLNLNCPSNRMMMMMGERNTNNSTTATTTTTEIPHQELVRMLYYLEGELQARDVVIAALRNERVKQYITQLRTQRLSPNDPYAAIFRDKIALSGHLISRESSIQAAQAESEFRQIIEQQMEHQQQMIQKQRATHARMVNILTESLENNQRMLQELEEEKRKHEHDTAQGDDITYGLEMERTKLRQELEEERTQSKKLEKDIKKLQETLEFERQRQKHIVLLLIAERKKVVMKFIEEGMTCLNAIISFIFFCFKVRFNCLLLIKRKTFRGFGTNSGRGEATFRYNCRGFGGGEQEISTYGGGT